jgi:MoaA/NifB/PqqE/SkfB family radical SAM enzyme
MISLIKATIYPTLRCNFECNHCYASSYHYENEMNREDYKEIFYKSVARRPPVLIGG